jgi:hypothetical protein
MGFSRLTDIETVDDISYDDARTAGLIIAGTLGRDCRDILEAVGLVPYLGHDRINKESTRTSRPVPAIRFGALQ